MGWRSMDKILWCSGLRGLELIKLEVLGDLAEQNAQLTAQVTDVIQTAYFAGLQQYFSSGEYDRRYAEAQERIRQQRGLTPFEQFSQQHQLWEAQQGNSNPYR